MSLRNELSGSFEFAYLAFQCGKLSDEDEYLCKETFLHKHRLAVVQNEAVKIEQVKDDQDDNADQGDIAKSSASGDPKGERKILRWNFPLLGDAFIDVK